MRKWTAFVPSKAELVAEIKRLRGQLRTVRDRLRRFERREERFVARVTAKRFNGMWR